MIKSKCDGGFVMGRCTSLTTGSANIVTPSVFSPCRVVLLERTRFLFLFSRIWTTCVHGLTEKSCALVLMVLICSNISSLGLNNNLFYAPRRLFYLFFFPRDDQPRPGITYDEQAARQLFASCWVTCGTVVWSVQFDVIEPDVRDEADEGEKTIQRSIRA